MKHGKDRSSWGKKVRMDRMKKIFIIEEKHEERAHVLVKRSIFPSCIYPNPSMT